MGLTYCVCRYKTLATFSPAKSSIEKYHYHRDEMNTKYNIMKLIAFREGEILIGIQARSVIVFSEA